jgi:hypothetical protein
MENHSGEGGPRYELQELLVWLEGVRKIQRFLGFAESELTYLYDIAVWGNTPIFPAPLPSPWKSERLTATHCLSCRVLLKPRPVVDNCSANRAQNGLLSMIDIVRRYEYEYLKTIRSGMGKFVATVTVSCQLHDSNLVNVLLSKLLRMLDTTEPDPFQPEINPAVPEIKGNKQTESFSFNAVRFLATCFKRSKEWKAFMLSEYGDTQGIKSIKSARFWAVSLHRFTLERPPPFYHPWLRQCLRKRARARMREEWPSMLARAMMRWEAVCQAAEIADEQVEALTEKAATALAKVKELPGGNVLLEGDDEVAPLPAGTLLTLDMFRNIKFEERTDRRGGGTGWTLDAVKNQLRLWNLRRPEWSELEVDMFSQAGLIEPGKAFNLSGTRAVLVKRLRLILTTQRAAERRQAVLDTAMRRLDQEQEEERVAQEQADSVAERQSRRGRGENAWRTRG